MDVNVKQEQELIAQARGKDSRAFSALVELYQERAVHIAYSLIGNYEDARDMAQEAFVKAYGRLDRFKGESGFYTWFYRLLVNHCKDFLRKKKIRRHLSFWLGSGQDDEPDPAAKAVSGQKSASEMMDDGQLGARIRQATEALPVQQKTAFSLRYLEGLSITDIASSMGISEGAVKAHLWQAVQKMKKALNVFVYGEETP